MCAVVAFEAAEGDHLESARFEHGRGTRGTAAAVSGGEDRTVLRQLTEARFEL